MYLVLITIGLCAVYLGLCFLFPLFFEQKRMPITTRSVWSIGIITTLSLAGYGVAFLIRDPDVSNRFLHGFGGCFLAFCVCVLAIRDSGVCVSRWRFVALNLLLVTALGVVNELAEFVLQNYLGMTAAESINDTWLDLISNTVGMLLAAVALIGCVPAKK